MKKSLFVIVMLACCGMFFAQQYSRDLKYDPKQKMFGDDVIYVQQKFLDLGIAEFTSAQGWYDEDTMVAVETFQQFFGFEVTGEVNQELFNYLGTYESEAGLAKYVAGVKTACYMKYRKHHLVKDLPETGLSAEGGLLTAYYDNKNGGTVPVMAVQNLYDYNGRVKNVLYPLNKESYIYLVMNENYAGAKDSGSVEYLSYFVDKNKPYILKNGSPEQAETNEKLAVNPARIMKRLKDGR